MYDKLIPGNIVSFNVYPVAYLGHFDRVKVEGIVDYANAVRMGFDPISLHVRVFPTLPNNAPNNARDYHYVRVQTIDGQSHLIGLPWIKPETLQVHPNNRIAVVKIELTSEEDPRRLMEVLNANKFHGVQLTVQ